VPAFSTTLTSLAVPAKVKVPPNATYEGMFAWDSTGNKAYVADDAGWVKLIDENASVGDLSNDDITGVANGNGLIWSSAQGRFNVGALPSTGFSIAMAVTLCLISPYYKATAIAILKPVEGKAPTLNLPCAELQINPLPLATPVILTFDKSPTEAFSSINFTQPASSATYALLPVESQANIPS
jgi:hypothetical protein